MESKRGPDLGKFFKHFGNLGDFLSGVLDEADEAFEGGKSALEGIKVTKGKSGDGATQVVILEVEVPGCASEDVCVSVEGGNLSVSWTSKMSGRPQERTFSLSKNADVDRVSAVVRNGYLTVTVPSLPSGPSGRARKVSVG